MLHHPFTSWVNLLLVNSQAYKLYINAFQACNQLHTYSQDFYTNPDPDLEAECSDLDNKSDKNLKEQADNYLLANFKAFAY